MGNQSPKPTITAANNIESCQIQIPAIKVYQHVEDFVTLKAKTMMETIKNDDGHGCPQNNSKTSSEAVQQVLKQSNERVYWPQNHKITIKLPDVKPPLKKQLVKKTKEVREIKERIEKQNAITEQEVEQLRNVETVKSDAYDTEVLTNRGKTAPLISSAQNMVLEFGKTKRCRVSRML